MTSGFFNSRDLHRHLVYVNNLVRYLFKQLPQETNLTKCKHQNMKNQPKGLRNLEKLRTITSCSINDITV